MRLCFFREWSGGQVITAVPAGKKIPGDTLEWLKAFAREKSKPLVFSERILEDGAYVGRRMMGYGPPPFMHAVETQVGPEDIMTF